MLSLALISLLLLASPVVQSQPEYSAPTSDADDPDTASDASDPEAASDGPVPPATNVTTPSPTPSPERKKLFCEKLITCR